MALSYAKAIAHVAKMKLDLSQDKYRQLKESVVNYQKEHTLIMNSECEADLIKILSDFFEEHKIKASMKRKQRILSDAYEDTYNETFQAMEAFIHNLNTMHSRAGRGTAMVKVPVTWETLCPAV